jgi:hypothetical protein
VGDQCRSLGFEDEDEDDWLGSGFAICYLLFVIRAAL